LLALRESEVAAQASGIHVARYKTLAFAISALYTGVAGGLFAFVVGFLSPDAFDVFLSVDFVAMIILGGLGSVPGSVAGAAGLTGWTGMSGGRGTGAGARLVSGHPPMAPGSRTPLQGERP